MTKKTKRDSILLVIGIVLFGANLRSPIVTVGPVVPEIIDKLHLTPTSVSLLTTIPLICFSFLSTFMPVFSRRIGLERFLGFSLLLLASGVFLRSEGSIFMLLFGSVLVGIGITIGNVMMPAFIKKRFPLKAGIVTGWYLISMNIISAAAVGFSIPLGKIFDLGWRSSIGIWSIPAFLTFFCWILLPGNHQSPETIHVHKTGLHVWKSRLAWQISIFMGLQSVIFYVLAAFFPMMLQDWGMDEISAGWMLSYLQIGSVPMALIGPLLTDKMEDLTSVIWLTFLIMIGGLLLIVLFKTKYIITASLLIGIAVGLVFSLATMFFILRTRTVEEAASLSGMAQSIGYLEAACAPPLFGAIFEMTGSWTIPMFLLFIATIILLITGLKSAKKSYV